MKIVGVAQQKGGVGKTTIAVNLAAAFETLGARVHLFDADPQQSACAWAAPGRLRFQLHTALLDERQPIRWAKSILRYGGDIAFVDTCPGLGSTFSALLDVSDLILLPCGPSSIELIALRQTIEAINDLSRQSSLTPELLIVPSRVDGETIEGQHLLSELAHFGPKVAPVVPLDINFARVFTSGDSICSAAKGSLANHAIISLANCIISNLSWHD